MTDVVSFIGSSTSGKTTLIVSLIKHLIADGRRVGAIKHTHHPMNTLRKGDTQRFYDAGASPVILAGTGEAVVFSASDPLIVHYASPPELLTHIAAEVVLVEGFKRFTGWPCILVRRAGVPLPDLDDRELEATIDVSEGTMRILSRDAHVPTPVDPAGLLRFLDTIWRR
ncbi:MAG TPA: molybdopterin-guanine dinucleotide biosynthesis protein B [Thermoanaerobaculia bacterium]|nr:molybdopterin-guanine dinucleotide biosynthesis protein B [Thermoanaerobaculia bacterium]